VRLFLPIVTVVLTLASMAASLAGFMSGQDRLGRWPHKICQVWARLLMWPSPVSVTVCGAEHLNAGPYVIVSNHLSVIDNVLALAYFSLPFRFFGHRRYFRMMPAMYFARYIPVDTRKPRQTRQRLQQRGTQFLQHGISMLIFAEGTRSADGQFHHFKSGAFELAVKNGVKILPVAIQGSYQAMPKGSLKLKSSDVTVHILDPIESTGATAHGVDLLRTKTHQAIHHAMECAS